MMVKVGDCVLVQGSEYSFDGENGIVVGFDAELLLVEVPSHARSPLSADGKGWPLWPSEWELVNRFWSDKLEAEKELELLLQKAG